MGAVRDRQDRIAREGIRDDGYDVPYTALHVGRIDGGQALNIVLNSCTVDFEIRDVAPDDAGAVLDRLRDDAARIASARREAFPDVAARVEVLNSYPGLATPRDVEVVRFVGGLVGSETLSKVAFGTEAGLFSERLGVPTVVCGPGSMEQGHKPDEWIALEQLDACGRMLDRLLQRCG